MAATNSGKSLYSFNSGAAIKIAIVVLVAWFAPQILDGAIWAGSGLFRWYNTQQILPARIPCGEVWETLADRQHSRSRRNAGDIVFRFTRDSRGRITAFSANDTHQTFRSVGVAVRTPDTISLEYTFSEKHTTAPATIIFQQVPGGRGGEDYDTAEGSYVLNPDLNEDWIKPEDCNPAKPNTFSLRFKDLQY